MRHPITEKGRVSMTLCISEGKIAKEVITKKNSEQFKVARKIACGDPWTYKVD